MSLPFVSPFINDNCVCRANSGSQYLLDLMRLAFQSAIWRRALFKSSAYKADLCHDLCKQSCIDVQNIALSLSLSQ